MFLSIFPKYMENINNNDIIIKLSPELRGFL